MRYYNEYKETENKDEFVNLLLKRYKHLKKATAIRRWYDVKKYSANEIKLGLETIKDLEPSKPNHLKLLMLQEMEERGFKLTNSFLLKHGFKHSEINWIILNH